MGSISCSLICNVRRCILLFRVAHPAHTKTLNPTVPPLSDRRWGIWGSHDNKPKAIVHLLKADYTWTPCRPMFHKNNSLERAISGVPCLIGGGWGLGLKVKMGIPKGHGTLNPKP